MGRRSALWYDLDAGVIRYLDASGVTQTLTEIPSPFHGGIQPNALWTPDAGLSDGSALASVTDASGNGWTMAQATSGKRPTKQTRSGFPVMRFNSTNSQELATSAPVTTAVDDFAMYVVADCTDTTPGRAAITNGFSYGILPATHRPEEAGTVGAGYNGVQWLITSQATPAAGTFAIYLLRRVGGSGKLYMNGGAALVTSANTPITVDTATFLGQFNNGDFYSGDIAEAAIFNPAPSVAEVNAIFADVVAAYSALSLSWSAIS